MLFDGPPSLRGLSLERAERAELALRLDDVHDCIRAEGTDQFVFEIGHAHEEAVRLHGGTIDARTIDVRAESRRFDAALEVALLADVAEAEHTNVASTGSVDLEVAADVRGAAHRDDGDAATREIESEARGECLDGNLVACAFDEDDRVVGGKGQARRSNSTMMTMTTRVPRPIYMAGQVPRAADC
jgi:hypothetical protein